MPQAGDVSGDPPGTVTASNGGAEQEEQGKGLKSTPSTAGGGCRQHPPAPAQPPTSERGCCQPPHCPSPTDGQGQAPTHRLSKSKPGFPLALPALPLMGSLLIRSPFPSRAHLTQRDIKYKHWSPSVLVANDPNLRWGSALQPGQPQPPDCSSLTKYPTRHQPLHPPPWAL